MNNLKRILALVLILIMLFSFTACHKKNEIAVTVGDVKFTSAYYSCTLVMCDSQAKSKVNENLTDVEKNSNAEIDYYKKEIDGKKFVDWVEDETLKHLTDIAAYKTLCKKNNIKLDNEKVKETKEYAESMWNSGYQAYLEINGISLKTFTDYQVDLLYADTYFESIYGKGGTKEIAADKVKAELYDKFVIANMLPVQFSQETEAQKKEVKTKLDGFAEELKTGKKTFEQVYNEYNGITEENHDGHDHEEADKDAPVDKYASIIGHKDTNYANDRFDEIKAMELNEVKIIALDNSSGYILTVKKDISADPYYLENLDIPARHLLVKDEFEKEIDTFGKKLKIDINKYAVSQFKVKKINFPE